MKILIEFYRTREADDAHAVIGREFVEAADLDDAIEIARVLAKTLNMPQRPDALTIADATGATLYSGVLATQSLMRKGQRHECPQHRNRSAALCRRASDLGK